MKKIIKNEIGFGAVGILIVILVVSLIGVSGYYIYNSNRNKTEENNSATPIVTDTPAKTESDKEVDSNEGYF